MTTAGAAALGIHLNPHSTDPARLRATAASLDADRMSALLRANRSLVRSTPAPADSPPPMQPSPPAPPAPKRAETPKPTPTPTPTPTPKPAATPKPAPKPTAKPKPKPLPHISGLTATQVANAWAIVSEGHVMGVSKRGQVIAMATALQESNLVNYTHAVDHDSLGLFQQRPSMGWGTRKEITTPIYAARAFYRVLLRYKSSWTCLTCAAQRVQRSAFPGAYAKHEHFATEIVTILNRRF